ncbi:hypothetical protein [Roseicyclus marinus]|uniref:Uncharacterized protein n=1 Tax=Roseicyclus marinus TaxID=2161673 RepID=A0AA48KH75_9RHOB|nr:hypothetical protein MACH21_05190 [Roseicyclus marinus]
MRLSQISDEHPQDGTTAGQPELARPLSAGLRRSRIWSVLHLLGAGLFVLAMITHLAQAQPDSAPSPTGAGAAQSPSSERALPSDPHKI